MTLIARTNIVTDVFRLGGVGRLQVALFKLLVASCLQVRDSFGAVTFIPNAQQIARDTITDMGYPELAEKFGTVIRFLVSYPKAASLKRGKCAPMVGTLGYITAAADKFASSREPRSPEPPNTVPDEMVSFILHNYFNTPKESLDQIKRDHLLSMGAENLVGDILERYIATALEPAGWVWISGSLVKGADFLKIPTDDDPTWQVLQVKNRDNSENSSSSAIRDGTNIKKWYRTFSKKPGNNWNRFPDIDHRNLLSEDGFKEFVRAYLIAIKLKSS